jgi:hypothetical protein
VVAAEAPFLRSLCAAIAALEDEIKRRQREEEAAEAFRKEEREHLEASAAFLKELEEAAEVLVRANLVGAGCRKRKGEWSREREHHGARVGEGRKGAAQGARSPLREGGGGRQERQEGTAQGGTRIRSGNPPRKSAPEIISRTSDIDRRGRWALIKTIAANDPLTEEMVEAVGEVAEEVLRENGKEEEAAENLPGKAMLLWGNVYGLVSLTTIDRLLDGQEEAERLAEQAVRVHLSSWRGG